MTELRDIIEQASVDLDTYKRHDPEAARVWINKLLEAGKLGGIGEDRIDSISIQGGRVYIDTSYSVRSCAQEARHEFPEHVLDAEDPIDAISAWAWGERVADAQEKVDEAKRLLAWREAELKTATTELATAMAS